MRLPKFEPSPAHGVLQLGVSAAAAKAVRGIFAASLASEFGTVIPYLVASLASEFGTGIGQHITISGTDLSTF